MVDKNFISEEMKVRLIQYGFDEDYFENILYQQAFRWFREKKGLFGFVEQITKNTFKFFVKDYRENKGLVFASYVYDNYEEAESECLKKLFEI
jgi:hypothetical protein